ncbi:transmembrane and coiled-coil domains protein 2-like isoform X2 [Actinia tenebrosa]|uniref:Transmembrane and coiled-coil domains protein 2-like isoform X2 n=1 Tax=Actinia tenebrosa TaxID=6105 RepID=A0A6P8IVJ0_ACTTE|nr:transmembrane and coiled-coil domains protein 2-like isoform X2 [Actinia tenebrosa]
MASSPKKTNSNNLSVPTKNGSTGSSSSLTSETLRTALPKHSPSPKRSPSRWFKRKDGTKSDSEMQESELKHHYIPKERPKHFSKVLSQIKEGSRMQSSRRRSKTSDVSLSSSGTGGVDVAGGNQGMTTRSGSAELHSGRSNTALSATDEENMDLDSLDGIMGSQEKDTDEVDGQVDSERIAHAIERLKRKIAKTKQQIRQLQEERDESVKEYLESTEGMQNQAKVKINFEKKNQKTNATIAQLQRKLQKYHKAMVDLEENGTLSSKVMAKEVLKGVKDNIRGISGGVKDGVKGAVSKPLEIIKNKFGSAENVSTVSPVPGSKTDGMDEEHSIASVTEENESRLVGSDSDRNFPQAAFSPHYISDDDSSSAASGAPASLPHHHSSPRYSLPPSPPVTFEQDINDVKENQSRLNETIDSLKEQLDLLARSLQEERYKSEHLQCQLNDLTSQWNDMTELHQNEMMSLKIELERAEERMECVEYRLSERAGEIEEALDSYVTRITKVETVQQQNQQMVGALDDYLEQSVQAKALFSKFLSVVLAVLAIILIVFTSIGRMIVPFTRTRGRLIFTSILIITLILIWKYQDSDVITAVFAHFARNSATAREKINSLLSPIWKLFYKEHNS